MPAASTEPENLPVPNSGETAPVPFLARWSVTGAATALFGAGLLDLVLGGPFLLGCLAAFGGFFTFSASRILHLAYLKESAAGQVLTAGPNQDLKRQLAREQFLEGVETFAEQAMAQLKQLSERFAVFEATLGEKFMPGELTYQRYHEAARAVQGAMLDRLREVSASAQELHAMHPRDIAERIARAAKGEEVPAEELAALRERQGLVDASAQRMRSLLADNERALTELDGVTAALRQVKTAGHDDLDRTLERLHELAARAGKYSTGGN